MNVSAIFRASPNSPPYDAVDPLSVEGGESLVRVVGARAEFLRAGERSLRFLGCEASGPCHRQAVAGLQFEPALTRRGGVLDVLSLDERCE